MEKKLNCAAKKKNKRNLRVTKLYNIQVYGFQKRTFFDLFSHSATDFCNSRACSTEEQGDQSFHFRYLIWVLKCLRLGLAPRNRWTFRLPSVGHGLKFLKNNAHSLHEMLSQGLQRIPKHICNPILNFASLNRRLGNQTAQLTWKG